MQVKWKEKTPPERLSGGVSQAIKWKCHLHEQGHAAQDGAQSSADGDDADGNNVENSACFFCSINKKLLDKMEKRTQFRYFTGQADVWKILIFDG